MLNALFHPATHVHALQTDEACRHAYNAAFEELGLSWHWDAATYARLQTRGSDAVRSYLETEQAHLLRAYEADFLVRAIESTRARCHASKAGSQAGALPGDTRTPAGGRNVQGGAPTHRFASTSLSN